MDVQKEREIMKRDFTENWNNAYEKNTNLTIWPMSDLITYVKKFIKINKKLKILELGCGMGANIPFLLSLGVQYYAIDGSEIAIKRLQEKFPELKNRLLVEDFTDNIPFSGYFDVIIDRSSLTHNDTNSISNCIEIIEKKLVDNGMFIGIDWFSQKHSAYQHGGEKFQDDYTKFNFKSGQFNGTGIVHFSDKNHLENLFEKFNFKILEHKIINKEIPEDEQVFAAWNFVVTKK